MNYRLGIFGYLSTGDKELPGNLGQKDQRLALKWVHENIANFGGDPSRVTIAGQSAGGASAHFHILANSSHKYFSRAISMSGNAFCPWAIMTKRHIKLKNRRLSKSTGCPLTTSTEFVDCLRKMSSQDLTEKFLSLFEFLIFPAAPLALVIEDDHPDAFLTEHPDEIYARNGAAKVPFICSRMLVEVPLTFEAFENIQERFTRIRPNTGKSVEAGFHDYAPLLLEYRLTADNPNSVTDKLIDFYMKSKSGNASLAILSVIEKAGLDRMFAYGTHKSLQRHSRLAPTYSYMFGYKGRGSTLSSIIGLNHKDLGVCHMDDMIKVFNISTGWDAHKTTDPEYAIVKLMTSLFYNFADKGEPLYTDESDNNHQIWNPVTDPRHIQVLQIDEEVRMIPEQNTQRLKFWESLDLPDMKPFIPIE